MGLPNRSAAATKMLWPLHIAALSIVFDTIITCLEAISYLSLSATFETTQTTHLHPVALALCEL